MLGLDDISIRNGLCYTPAGCDFENDYCGYRNTQTYEDDFDWLRGKGSATNKAGPSVDHTLGDSSGYYAYFEQGQILPMHAGLFSLFVLFPYEKFFPFD